jgi:peptidyl-prolyl cis-trans isomerase SurA
VIVNLKVFKVGLVVLLIFLGRNALSDNSIPLGRVVAVVGDGVITDYDLEKEINVTKEQLRANNTFLPNEDKLRAQILDRLISRKILLDFADRTGIRISSEEIANGIAQVARGQNKSTSDFLDALERQGAGVLEDFRQRVETELKIDKLRRRDLDSKIRVSEAEINFFLAKQVENPDKDQYLTAHILIKIDGSGDEVERDRSMEKAIGAIQRIDQGEDFRTVAAELSDASDALEGGLLGWRAAEQLPSLFLDKLTSMKLQQRSDIFESPNGFHILFLYDKKVLDQKIVVEQTHASHILIKVEQFEDENLVRSRTQEVRDRLILGGEDFATVAKNLSSDFSAANGGDLGWLGPGETVPEFEKAMNQLAVGEISEVVRSQFGFHIIVVHGRRDADLSDDRKRAIAQQTISQRKLENRFEGWIQEMRDKTFVEIKL